VLGAPLAARLFAPCVRREEVGRTAELGAAPSATHRRSMNAKTIGTIPLAGLLLALGASCHSTGKASGPPPDQQEMMQRWTAFATPGKAHEVLASKVGTWNLKVHMFMSPGAPSTDTTGTSTMQWIMDGRYIQDTTTGDFNGQPFHGSGLMGYDNMKHAYVGSWIDNMGTAIVTSEGHYDAKSKTFHFTSMMPDAMVAQAYVHSSSTETWTDSDHWVMRTYSPGPDGKDYLNMEIEYARAR